MSEADVINYLSSIPIGTIIAWISVTVLILGFLGFCLLKLYKLFEVSSKIRDENNSFRNMVETHDLQLQKINEQLGQIQDTLKKQDKVSLKKLRHSIIRAGEEAVSNNKITIRELRSLEELYEEYQQDYNGNGYVSTLMKKIRCLEVVGKLDENDEDIE